MVGLIPIAKKVIQRFIYLKLYLLSSGAPTITPEGEGETQKNPEGVTRGLGFSSSFSFRVLMGSTGVLLEGSGVLLVLCCPE